MGVLGSSGLAVPLARVDEARAAALSRIATVRTEARIPGLIDLLGGAGVSVLVLKGPVTRQRLYAPDELRPTADVDLLVAPGAFRRAARALRGSGFERVHRCGHSDTFGGPDGVVDLHLALPFATVPPALAFRRLLAHAASMEVAGRTIRVLDEPAHVVHLAVHAAQNGFDPAHRSLEEWRRGWASLSFRERASAELVVDDLGLAATWVLARLALGRPGDGERLAEALPERALTPSLPGLWALASSSVPARVKGRIIRAAVQRQLSDDALLRWRAERGLPAVLPGTWSARSAKVRRLVAVTGSSLVGRRG